MASRKLRRRLALGIVLVVLTAGGVAGYLWSVAHIGDEMGAEYVNGDLAHLLGDASILEACWACHFSARGGTLADRWVDPTYLTPHDIEECPDDGRLLVPARDSNLLLVLDGSSGEVTQRIPVGRRPTFVVADAGCRHAYVSAESDDAVSVVDLSSAAVTATVPVGYAPAGLALSPDGQWLFVANRLSDDLSVLRLPDLTEATRIATGRHPIWVEPSPDGRTLLVAAELSTIVRHPAPPWTELTRIDMASLDVVARYRLENANVPGGIAYTPDGRFALIPLMRPHNLIPILQNELGWVMTTAVAVVEMATGQITQVSLDDSKTIHSDPAGIALTPDGSRAIVTSGGKDLYQILDVPALLRIVADTPPDERPALAEDLAVASRYVLDEIDIGANPTAVLVSRAGGPIYIVERFDDSLCLVDPETLEPTRTLGLGGPEHITTLRNGEIQFHQAGEFACRSCHPHGENTGLLWDFEPDGLGEAITDIKPLRAIRDTKPYKWVGTNTSAYMQCGIRFERFVSRRVAFTFEETNSLAAYLDELGPGPRRREALRDTESARRGEALFLRERRSDGTAIPKGLRCATCHEGPLYTNCELEDVGTGWPEPRPYDTPQLTNLADTAPYLHDGRALTIEELWTEHNPNDIHGVTSDLTSEQIQDLTRFLETL